MGGYGFFINNAFAGDTPFCWGKPDKSNLRPLVVVAGDTPFCWVKLIPPLDLLG